MAAEVALAVRALHLLAVAVVLGGAAVLAFLAFRRAGPRTLVAVAVPYEALFWAAAGILVLSGVGNAGAFGRDVPSAATPWGGLFLVKLLLVLALVLGSMLRTFLVAFAAAAEEPPPRTAPALAWAYAGTAVLATLPAVLGVTLAHGGA